MWKTSDRLYRWAVAALFALALPIAQHGALAQTAQPPAGDEPAVAAATGSQQDIRREIELRYEVLPIREGIVLRPNQARRGVRTVELSGAGLAVNGEPVSEAVLRDWLGDEEAELILRLQRLAPRDRQFLFGLEVTAGKDVDETPAPAEEAEAAPSGEPVAGELPEVPDLPDLPEPPEIPSEVSGSRVKVFGGFTVHKGEVAQEAVAILGSVRVDGEVASDVVAVGGSATINGRVGGSVTAVGGGVRLGPNAEVMGEVTSVGGTVERAEGAKIHGQVSEVPMPPHGQDWDHDIDVGFFPWRFWGRSMDLFWEITGVLVLGMLVCLCLLIARRAVERSDQIVATEPWQAGLVGFASQLLFVPLLIVVSVLLVITIVGCALFLLYPFLFLALLLAALVGYSGVAYRLGRILEARFGRSFGNPYGVALIGVLAIEIWGVLARLIGLGGGPLRFLSFLVLAFSVAVQYVAWTVGFGAFLMAWFRSPGRMRPATMPAGPAGPIPPPPGSPASAGPGSELPLSERWEGPAAGPAWEEPPPER